jgi:pimeloyl-ACP methyl ester carboxylesterase
MTTFVLLHGGGMGGWTWRYVADPLRAAGHDVLTPTFTGFGERVHLLSPDVTNDVHVTDVVNVLHYEAVRDAVLVGHSYGGTVIPGVVAQAGDRIRRAVYVDAIVTDPGESVMGAMGAMPEEQAAGVLAAVAAGQAGPGSGVDVQEREARKSNPLDMPAERQEWLLGRLSDMPLAGVASPIGVGADSLTLPVDYIAATADPTMAAMHIRARKLGWTVHEWDCDHGLNVGRADELAAFLLERA